MAQFIITESQLEVLKSNLTSERGKSEKQLDEAWYNTVMDIVGIADPTGVVDIVNGISYFTQGDTLFGILSIVSAIPYAGDVVAKPVMGALKLGSASTKTLQSALKTANKFPRGSKEYDLAIQSLENLAKKPNVVGKFLQSAGGANGWASKINRALDGMPLGVFKGMKNTIMDYFTLLGRAGQKSKGLQSQVSMLLRNKSASNLQKNIPIILDTLKTTKIFDTAALSKPGFMSQVFFGGIPRIFRSPEGRRLRILMQSTKWWLGFLDYIGLGNFVGVEEVAKRLGDEEFQRKLGEYQNTSQARQYYDEEFSQQNMGGEPSQQSQQSSSQTSSSQSSQGLDPFAKLLQNLFLGQINPIPGL